MAGQTKGLGLASLGLAGTILYLGAQAVTGPQGLMAYVDLQAQERSLESRLADLGGEREALETRLARLDPAKLDTDYLDELSRRQLGWRRPDEKVFALNETK